MDAQPNSFDTPISISNVLSESWELVRGVKAPVAGLVFLHSILNTIFFIVFFIIIIPSAMNYMAQTLAVSPGTLSVSPETLPVSPDQFSSFHHSSFGLSHKTAQHLMLNPIVIGFGLIFGLLSSFFTAAQFLIGAKQALGLKPTVGMVLADCMHAFPRILVLFFIFIFPWIFFHLLHPPQSFSSMKLATFLFHLLVIVGTVLTTWACFAFAIPLMIIKEYPLILAAVEGMTAAISYWWPLLRLSCILTLIIIASFFTLGIFLFWSIPMSLNMHGIVFREIFKSQGKPATPSTGEPTESLEATEFRPSDD